MQRSKPRIIAEIVMLLISLSVFISMLLWNLFLSRSSHWVSLAIFLVAPVSFISVYFYLCRHTTKPRTRRIILVSFGIIFGILTLGNCLFSTMLDGLDPTQKASAYTEVLMSYGYPASKGVAHFPQEIPEDAKNVVFFEEPSFGPAGATLVLKYSIDSVSINRLYDEYIQKALDMGDSTKIDDNGLRSRIAIPLQLEMLPSDFSMIILRYHDEATSGFAYGVSISKQRDEIIYWYVNW